MAGAIARSGDRYQEFNAEGSLPFDALRSDIELTGGRVATDALLLEAPRLRILISGSLQVDELPNDLEIVIGIFPDSTVDSIVGKVPIFGPILQGPDEKLVAAYLEATGPWRDPQVLTINVSGDRNIEADEEFTVALSGATAGAIITPSASRRARLAPGLRDAPTASGTSRVIGMDHSWPSGRCRSLMTDS